VESLFAQMTLKQIVEALVFASPKPLSTKEIVAALKSAGNPEKTEDATALAYARTKEDEVLTVLLEIQTELESSGRAFRLMEQINGWSFVTDPSAVHWVRQLYPEAKPTRLTGPQLETLAIIAYRQPVTRADIEAVRGVAVDGVVQVLMERSLIKIAGRADVPGRPLLYETTEYFLQHFGLKTVHELPNAAELRRVELPKAVHSEAEPAKEKTKKAKHSGETAAEQAVVIEGAAETPMEEPIASSESPGSQEINVSGEHSASIETDAPPTEAPQFEPAELAHPESDESPDVDAEPLAESNPSESDAPPELHSGESESPDHRQ
jgi:segregation and condensation protein B